MTNIEHHKLRPNSCPSQAFSKSQYRRLGAWHYEIWQFPTLCPVLCFFIIIFAWRFQTWDPKKTQKTWDFESAMELETTSMGWRNKCLIMTWWNRANLPTCQLHIDGTWHGQKQRLLLSSALVLTRSRWFFSGLPDSHNHFLTESVYVEMVDS